MSHRPLSNFLYNQSWRRYHIWTVYVPENCAVLDYYSASSGNFSPTFRDNFSVPSSSVNYSWPLTKGPKCCPETSARNYYCSLWNSSEEHSSHPLRGGSLNSRMCVLQFASHTSYFNLSNHTTERALIAPIKYNSAAVFGPALGWAYFSARFHNAWNRFPGSCS
jgi:hypothetical protein